MSSRVIVQLKIKQLDREHTQCRESTDQMVAQHYANLIRDGVNFPEPVVFKAPDGRYYLADGFHRVLAYEVFLGRLTILVELRHGTLRDAIIYATGANAKQGRQMDPKDRRLAGKKLIKANPLTEDGKPWSLRAMAEHVGVSPGTIHNWRGEIAEQENKEEASAKKPEPIKASAQIERQPDPRTKQSEAMKAAGRRAIEAGHYRRADEHMESAIGELEDCDMDDAGEPIALVQKARKIVQKHHGRLAV